MTTKKGPQNSVGDDLGTILGFKGLRNAPCLANRAKPLRGCPLKLLWDVGLPSIPQRIEGFVEKDVVSYHSTLEISCATSSVQGVR